MVLIVGAPLGIGAAAGVVVGPGLVVAVEVAPPHPAKARANTRPAKELTVIRIRDVAGPDRADGEAFMGQSPCRRHLMSCDLPPGTDADQSCGALEFLTCSSPVSPLP